MKKTVVITGASSGIGLATALKLSEQKANLVLVARGQGALEDAASQCREKGAVTLTVTADVGDFVDVQKVSQQAVASFGGFNAWINCAGIAAYGSFLDIPRDQFDRVIQTNVIGCANGSRTALEHFYPKDDGGILINISSGLGTFPGPYSSPYVTSKYAVRGLTAAIRQELLYEKRPNIKLCTVFPATIDTPFYDHTANFSGKTLQALRPVYPANDVAKAIVKLLKKPRSEVTVGAAAKWPKFFYGIAPRFVERALAYYVARQNYKNGPSHATAGNLYNSTYRRAQVGGGWDDKTRYLIPLVLATVGAVSALLVIMKRKDK